MLLSEKITKMIKKALNESVQSFVQFMVQEYGRQVTKSELGQAIIGWADLYMQGANSGDFESVGAYITQDVYVDIIDSLPAMFVENVKPYMEFMQNGEETEDETQE
mgnify:CR=1 FL=1